MKSLPIKLGITVIMIMGALLTLLLLSTSLRIQYYGSFVKSDEVKKQIEGIDALMKFGPAGEKEIIRSFPDGETAAERLIQRWNSFNLDEDSQDNNSVLNWAAGKGYMTFVKVLLTKSDNWKKENAEVFLNRGFQKSLAKNYVEAIADYNICIMIDPADSRGYNNRAYARESMGQFQRALNDYGKSIELNPNQIRPRSNRGILYLRLKDTENAKRELDSIVEIKPTDAASWNCRGAFREGMEDYEGAISDYTNAIDLDPEFHKAVFNRGSVGVKTGKFEEALVDLTRAIEIKPEYAAGYNTRGCCLLWMRRSQEAINDFDKAIELDPDFALAYLNRGRAKFAQRNVRGAIEDYTTAIQIKPDFYEAYTTRGYVKLLTRKFEESIKDFDKATSINPDFVAPYHNRIDAYKALGNREKARENCNWVIEHRPGSVVYRFRAYLNFDLGNFDEALGDFQNAIRLDKKNTPSNTYSRFRICILLARKGELKEMKKYAKEKISPEGDWQRAIRSFFAGEITEEKFLESAKSADARKTREQLCEGYFYTAEIRLAKGDREGAKELYNKCIETGVKNFSEYTSAKYLLERMEEE